MWDEQTSIVHGYSQSFIQFSSMIVASQWFITIFKLNYIKRWNTRSSKTGTYPNHWELLPPWLFGLFFVLKISDLPEWYFIKWRFKNNDPKLKNSKFQNSFKFLLQIASRITESGKTNIRKKNQNRFWPILRDINFELWNCSMHRFLQLLRYETLNFKFRVSKLKYNPNNIIFLFVVKKFRKTNSQIFIYRRFYIIFYIILQNVFECFEIFTNNWNECKCKRHIHFKRFWHFWAFAGFFFLV